MRTLTDHKLTGLNEAIDIHAVDLPGPGGANHQYLIQPRGPVPPPADGILPTSIIFQKGPIGEAGINGISNEALLAILIDRMRGFQYQRFGSLKPSTVGEFDESMRGKFACRENALALTALEEAMMWLQKRTRDRMARGVEGKSVA